MNAKYSTLKRTLFGSVAIALVAAIGLPLMQNTSVDAAQLASRSIELSDSGPSGGTITSGKGSGTNVTYRTSFTTSGSAQSLVIDFCSNDPIISDTCTAPTGMSASSATAATVAGGGAMGGWTVTKSASQIKLSGGAAQAAGAQVFDLKNITNPSTTGSFYARIYTFSNATFGTYVSATSPGNFVDYGGIALSTASVITITARVQEQLTFCTSASDMTASDCTSATNPALTLGQGAPTAVLSPSRVDTANAYTQVSTNATSGVIIRMTNSNACGGLSADGGTTCNIPAINGGAATPSAMTAGTAAFGVNVSNGTASTGGSGTVTADPGYAGANLYGMDTTSAGGNNVVGTFGDTVASSSAPVSQINNIYKFAATPSLTTPAGIYTANMDLIATGTF